jgi:hypothetical protein
MLRKTSGLLIIFYLTFAVTNAAASPRIDSCVFSSLEEGVGLGNLVIGKSTASDAIASWGDKYELIEHHDSSYEMKFIRWGVSVYYRHADAEKKIIRITATSFRCKARTKKGIEAGFSTLGDVINAYGKAEPFTTSVTSANKTWFYEYAGIRFHTLFKSLTEADRKDFLKKKILMIEIIESR